MSQDGNNLVIVNAGPDVAGTYVCEISTPSGVINKFLVIRFPGTGMKPVILQPSHQQVFYVNENDEFELVCEAEGSPTPLVHISTPQFPQQESSYRPASSVIVSRSII